MKNKGKAQPAGAGRAGDEAVGAVGVNSANHSYNNTKADSCQAMSGESFRADMPQPISNKLAEVVRNVKKRAKCGGTGEPENEAFGEACKHRRPTEWTDVYVKIKVAFRQKALRLLKGAKLSCFLCIGLHIDGEGECYPSIDTIMRETGYSRATVCSALEELVELGFIEKERRKHDSTLYTVKGYVWYGSERKPTLLGEAQSKETLLSPPESKASERLPTKRLATLPKDEPSVKEQPLEKKEREISNSKLPSSSFSTENDPDEGIPESPFIDITVEKLARTLGDTAPLRSSITRTRRLWYKTELEEEEFVEFMEAAKRITLDAVSKSQVRDRNKKMAYFFAVLKDILGLE